MSILSVTELMGNRGGSIGQTFERTYVRTFDVVTSSPLVGPLAVRTAAGIPQIGAAYSNGLGPYDPLLEYDNGSVVNSVQAEEMSPNEAGGVAWKVTCTYGPWTPNIFGPDPTLWKLRVRFGGEATERVIDFDRDGTPIRNSATDRFGDPVTIPDHISTMTIERNELVSAFDLTLASDYSDSVNDATWNGFPALWCKMGIISTSQEQYDSNSQRWYYTVYYPVLINRKTWKKELLDQGYNELTGSYPGVPKPIMNGGQPISDPVMLDGSGHRAAVGADPVTLTFYPYDELDWSGLNIDLSLRLGL